MEAVPVTPPKTKEKQAAAAEAPAELGKIEVTGSRIQRTDYETAQPVVRIKREDIERTGFTNIGNLLQSLPSAGSALNTTFNNGGTGATEIDLRNLGSNRVLVLVDGHRWVNGLRSLATSSVDLNTIPLALVDHIEILQDGASAIYGSDAITGVVNIITRKNFEGLQFSAQGGEYTKGDGSQQLHSLTLGHQFSDLFGLGGQTSMFGNLSYQDQQGISAADRKISKVPKVGAGLTRASTFIPEARSLFIPNEQNGTALGTDRCPSLSGGVIQGVFDDPGGSAGSPFMPGQFPAVPITVPQQSSMAPAVQLCDIVHITGAPGSPAVSPDGFRSFADPDDRFNFALTNALVTPLKTYNGFAKIDHQFNSNFGLSLQTMYSYRRSMQVLAAQPVCLGNLCPIIGGLIPGQTQSFNQATFVAANNPFNPFGEDIGRPDASDPAGLVGQGAVLRRMVEAGQRIQLQHVPTQYSRLVTNGNFDLFSSLVNWEAGIGYGSSKQSESLFNSLNAKNIQQALGDPANCTAPCVPLNIFGGPGTITPEMLDFIRFTSHDFTKQQQTNEFVNFSTDIGTGLLPAGPLGVAFGFEARRDRYAFLPDPTSINGETSGLTSLPTNGAVSAKEGYLELGVPVLRDFPMVKELELDLAGRISAYQTFGKSKNYKLGLRWKPYQDLLLRGTFSDSFRAPDVGNLFLGLASSFPVLADPCVVSKDGPRKPNSDTDKNCTADGVPNDVTQISPQILSPFGGNPNLRPETSHSVSGGFVFSPEFAPGLDMTVDYFRISVDSFITAPDPQFLLDQCYTTDPNNRGTFACSQIVRDPNTHALQEVFDLFQNFSKIQTAGFDYNLHYRLPTELVPLLDGAGNFKVQADATFLSKYNQFVPSVNGGRALAGLDGTATGLAGRFEGGLGAAHPRWKISPSLVWNFGPWNASWNTHLIWKQLESCFDGIPPPLTDLGLCSKPDHVKPDGSPEPLNKIKTTARNDVQVGYTLQSLKTDVALGVINVFNTDPPVSRSAFENSFNPADYWVPGVLPYLRIKKDF